MIATLNLKFIEITSGFSICESGLAKNAGFDTRSSGWCDPGTKFG